MNNELRVWWMPQVPMESFYVSVKNEYEAAELLDTLARYDQFQYENNIKPDYSNAGGLEMKVDGEWVDWDIDDIDLGYYDDVVEYIEALKELLQQIEN